MGDDQQPATTKKLNKSISSMILNWINNFSSNQTSKVKSLKELSSGSKLVNLIKLVVTSSEKCDFGDYFDRIDLDDVNECFELIHVAMESQFFIAAGVNYQAAKSGNEYELAKIAFIVLINGVTMEVNEFVEASEKLETSSYQLIHTFYYILERAKLNFPPRSIEPYEEFLSSTNNERRSLNANHSRLAAYNSPGLLASPMRNASLNSPKRKFSGQQLSHLEMEDIQNEKRRLERELQKKELFIYELTDQMKERDERIKEFELKLDEYKRKIVDLNNYRDRTYDYENLLEKFKIYERENLYLEEKCKKISIDNNELVGLRQNFEKQQAKIITLNEQLSSLEKRELSNELELVRLRRLEAELNYVKEMKIEKENKILQLIDEKGKLETQIMNLNESLNQLRQRFNEQYDQLSGENAMYQNKLSSANAQLSSLRQENEEKIKDLEFQMAEYQKKIKALEETYQATQDVYNEGRKRENEEHEQQVRALEEKLKSANAELAGKVNDFQSLQKFLNELQRDRDDEIRQYESELENLRNELTMTCDNLNEVKESLNSLKREEELKDKAAGERHEALTSELNRKQQELESLTATIETLRAEKESEQVKMANECEQLSQQIGAKNEEIAKLEASLLKEQRKYESRLDELNSEFTEKEKRVEQMLREINEAHEQDKRQYLAEIDALGKEIEMRQADVAQMVEMLDCERAKTSELEARLDMFGQEKESLLDKIKADEANLANLDEHFRAKCDELNACQTEFDSFRNQSNEESSRLRQQLDDVDGQLVQAQQESMRLSALHDELEQKHAEAVNEYERRLAELNDEFEKAKEEIQELKALNDELRVNVDKCDGNWSEKFASKCDELANFERELDAVRTSLHGQIEQLESKCHEMDDKLREKQLEIERLAHSNDEMKSANTELSENYELSMKKANAELADVRMQIEQHKMKNDRLISEYQENEKKLLEKTMLLNEKTNDYNLLKNEFNKLFDKNEETLKKLLLIEANTADFSKENATLKQKIAQLSQSFDAKSKEVESLKYQLGESKQRVNEQDALISSRNIEIQRLTSNNMEMSAEYNLCNNRLQDMISSLQQQLTSVSKDFEVEKEQNASMQKRLRDEVASKQTELVSLNSKVKHQEEREKLHVKQIEELNQSFMEQRKVLEKIRMENDAYKIELQKVSSESAQLKESCDKLEEESRRYKEYGSQMESHYAKKKTEFQSNMEQFKANIGTLEKRNKQLLEELNFLKEKIKTINYENQQLRSQKEDMAKKLTDIPMFESGKENMANRTARAGGKEPVLSTPKNAFYDDSYVKYSSSGLRSVEDLNRDDDFSRRFSIDSFSGRNNAANASSSSMAPVMPAIGRFSSIFENGTEEISVDSKSFGQLEPAVHRLSTLQARNQQAKPHLKSSYPLEGFSENQINYSLDNKENSSRQSSVHSKTFVKRPIDADSADLGSPKKALATNENFVLRQSNL